MYMEPINKMTAHCSWWK